MITPELKEKAKELINWAISHSHNEDVRLYKGYSLATSTGVRINSKLELWELDDDYTDDTWAIVISKKELFTIYRNNMRNTWKVNGVNSIEELHVFEKVLDDIEKYRDLWDKNQTEIQKKKAKERTDTINDYAPIPEANVVKPLLLGLGSGPNINHWSLWLLFGLALILTLYLIIV